MQIAKSSRSVLICHGKSCRKMGATQVFAAFLAHPIIGVEVVACGCLAHCGNGPMVLILPEQIWYDRLQPTDVAGICDRHFGSGENPPQPTTV